MRGRRDYLTVRGRVGSWEQEEERYDFAGKVDGLGFGWSEGRGLSLLELGTALMMALVSALPGLTYLLMALPGLAAWTG